jgi:chromosome segregation ATPase
MDTPSLNLDSNEPAGRPARTSGSQGGGLISDGVKTVLIFVLIAAVGYLLVDNYRSQQKNTAELAKIGDRLLELENKDKMGEAKIATLKGEISATQAAVGDTKAEVRKTAQHAQQLQSEGQRTKSELTQALATKADSAQVDAKVASVRSETDSKIGQVTTEVGGVKTEVNTVKTDLATTRRDLEGTQRQLVDVKDTLSAAVAKNASELAQLRLKGERDYFEFTVPKKNQATKVEDVYVVLKSTDQKKGKYSMQIVVDDSRLEKKDRTINEPVQFLVGKNRVRYEVVVNWVQKDKCGGYLSYPRDKSLSAERPAKE